LWLRRGDGDFLANQRVHECRLADVRSSDKRDKPAA
jgi:hypothetical protein